MRAVLFVPSFLLARLGMPLVRASPVPSDFSPRPVELGSLGTRVSPVLLVF